MRRAVAESRRDQWRTEERTGWDEPGMLMTSGKFETLGTGEAVAAARAGIRAAAMFFPPAAPSQHLGSTFWNIQISVWKA